MKNILRSLPPSLPRPLDARSLAHPIDRPFIPGWLRASRADTVPSNMILIVRAAERQIQLSETLMYPLVRRAIATAAVAPLFLSLSSLFARPKTNACHSKRLICLTEEGEGKGREGGKEIGRREGQQGLPLLALPLAKAETSAVQRNNRHKYSGRSDKFPAFPNVPFRVRPDFRKHAHFSCAPHCRTFF